MLQSQTFTMKIPWLKFNMTMKKSMCFILILVLIPSVQLKSSKRQLEPGSQGLESVLQSDACPKLIPRYFSNVQPKGGLNNTWIKHPEVNNKEDCVKSCCVNQFCNMVFVYTNDSILTCYQVSTNRSFYDTLRNLHFLSKNLTLISRENCWFFGWKTRENVVVLDFLDSCW